MTVQMKCPTPVSNQVMVGNSVYKPDAFGFIQVRNGDIVPLLNAGFALTPIRDNLVATTDPTTTDDASKDYAVKSAWYNSTTGAVWDCFDATINAAVWLPRDVSHEVGRLLGANMNTTADQPFTMFVPGNAKFRVTKITVKNASISLTTAAGGVYTGAGKTGDIVVAAAQVYSTLTTGLLALDLTLVATPARTLYAQNIAMILALTTAQGAPATADLIAYGDIYN